MTKDNPDIPYAGDEDPVMHQVLELMNRCDPDHAHAIQVGRLSRGLFTGLAPLHGMNWIACRILCYASLLHDIGWSVPGVPHHKASMNLIISDQTITVSGQDRVVIALIARYHRKAHPSPDHQLFCTLPGDLKHQVRWSAALLRVADALDRAHDSRVQTVSCLFSEHIITLRCDTAGRPVGESDMGIIQKKALLLGEVSGRRIEVILV